MTNQETIIKPKYLVMDIVFYGGSLNYDQGTGNYQELKKVTMYDGSVKILVSRWALRYSMLEMGKDLFGWKLAKGEDFTLSTEVPSLNYNKFVQQENGKETIKKEILDFPEFDLFGFMIVTKKQSSNREESGKSFSRTTPVKISHAISLNSYNFNTQFLANLGIMKRAGKSGSNPVILEEFYGFYVYNVTVDLERIGVLDEIDESAKKLDLNLRKERVHQLIDIIMNLKRDIKGKREDLSPWLVIAGLYSNMNYDTFMDKIELVKSRETKVIRTEKKSKMSDDTEIIEITHYEENTERPKFKILDFFTLNNVFIYKRESVEIEGLNNNIISNKNEFINKIKEEISRAFTNN